MIFPERKARHNKNGFMLCMYMNMYAVVKRSKNCWINSYINHINMEEGFVPKDDGDDVINVQPLKSFIKCFLQFFTFLNKR